MRKPRLNTKCKRCGEPWGFHRGTGPENEWRCPSNDGGTFRRHTPHLGAAQSFTEREITVLDQVTRKLLQGGDLRSLAALHTDTLESLARKAAGMKRTAAARKAGP
jgi:hypothetical protein